MQLKEGISVEWSNAKTIFIITFLILNLFLTYQFNEKRDRSELDLITKASIEEKLAAEEIIYKELPKDPEESMYISGKPKFFDEESIKNFKNQEINIDNPALLQSILKQPFKLSNSVTEADPKIQQFLKEYVLESDSYKLWNIDEENGTILFFQHYKNQIFYNTSSNISGLLLVNFNQDKEVISYQQTMLVSFEEYENKEIISALKALEFLYQNDYLKPGSEVTKVELGYYPLEQLSESQILAPTWHIIVNGKTDYYVNAFEGQIFEIME